MYASIHDDAKDDKINIKLIKIGICRLFG